MLLPGCVTVNETCLQGGQKITPKKYKSQLDNY